MLLKQGQGHFELEPEILVDELRKEYVAQATQAIY